MKFKRKYPKYKKCPRCGNKCLPAQEKCEECGLIFSRMQFASNKAAKKKIRKFDKDFIIYTNQYPSDVSWLKLMLYVFFFGLVGGHYYYVGKYVKGGLMSASFVYLVFCTVFNAQMVEYLETYYLYLPIGIMALAWIVSVIYVSTKKFKVPVIVDIPDNVTENARKEFEQIKKEIKAEKAELKKKDKEKTEVEIVDNAATSKKNKRKNKNVKNAEAQGEKESEIEVVVQENPSENVAQNDKKEEN